MKRYISLNITAHSFEIAQLLKSTDPNVVSLVRDMVYNTVLKEFTKPYIKYGLEDEPINYDLVDRATENVIKELTKEAF